MNDNNNFPKKNGNNNFPKKENGQQGNHGVKPPMPSEKNPMPTDRKNNNGYHDKHEHKNGMNDYNPNNFPKKETERKDIPGAKPSMPSEKKPMNNSDRNEDKKYNGNK